MVDRGMTRVAAEKVIKFAEGATETVTPATMKEILPSEYLSALTKFGKTETEIVDYFTTYHNVRGGGKFLSDIESYLAYKNIHNLTGGEAYAIWGYTTRFFYEDLNLWLRNGENLVKTEEISKLINRGLGKIPKYQGAFLYRGIEIGPSELQSFLNSYKAGSITEFKAFTSCGGSAEASFADRISKNVIFKIQHISGKEISQFADGVIFGEPPMAAPEILMNSNIKLQVIGIPEFNYSLNKWVIELKELP